MRAIVQHHYGTSAQLRLDDVPDPVPGEGEVLVRVGAAGVDRGTWHAMTGLPLVARLGLGLRRPRDRTPGRDVAGTVEAVGPGVTGYAVGDAVYGTARGSFAELALVPTTRLARRPAALSVEEAAAVPVSGLTALQALRAARVGAGDRVLVIGASGGVGSFAVQLAVDLGAHVTAVCGPAKADLVRSLGAERVVDHTTTSLDGLGERFDAVLDIAGHRPVRLLRRLLTERGTLVVVGSEHRGRWLGGLQRSVGAALLSPFVRHRLVMLVATEDGADLAALTDVIERGGLRPAVERSFALSDAGAAVDHVAAGRARGKVVVVPDGTDHPTT
ncbi:NAD(P)-dependent alcohol dehydrogenase [Fodinibacter luteus]|uniref:NAD(P)-dependent alcohol dehydrogenase n=1 Tax=Fodinibacter luteus TaxID=552064 RepID=A0ABP8K230_9MICO